MRPRQPAARDAEVVVEVRLAQELRPRERAQVDRHVLRRELGDERGGRARQRALEYHLDEAELAEGAGALADRLEHDGSDAPARPEVVAEAQHVGHHRRRQLGRARRHAEGQRSADAHKLSRANYVHSEARGRAAAGCGAAYVGRAEADNELGGVRIERDGELLRQLAAERRHGSVLGVTQSEAFCSVAQRLRRRPRRVFTAA